MCGLFGATSKYLAPFEVEHVKDMSLLSYMKRGRDATGIIHVSKKEKANRFRVRYHKTLDNPPTFFGTPQVEDMLNDKARNTLAIVGHTRAATYGDKSVANAHPYKSEHIIGVHNGTIPSMSNYKDYTDSKVLFDLISWEGLEGALDSVNHGTFAIVYVDRKAGTLNFVRNEHRPLWFCVSERCDTLYWASEPEWFDIVLGKDKGTPYQIKPDLLMSIDLNTHETDVKELVYSKPRGYYGYGHWYLDSYDYWRH